MDSGGGPADALSVARLVLAIQLSLSGDSCSSVAGIESSMNRRDASGR